MNPSDLHSKLLRAARTEPAQENVPYAFEKRVMARLAAVSPVDFWESLGRPLWRCALSCVAITLLCGLWSLSAGPASSRDNSSDTFAQDLDGSVLASLNQHVEDAW